MTTIDMNVTQLMSEIERSRAQDDGTAAGVGLSVSRKVDAGVSTWDVFLGVEPGHMTVLDSQIDYHATPAAEIASVIVGCWDEAWDD